MDSSMRTWMVRLGLAAWALLTLALAFRVLDLGSAHSDMLVGYQDLSQSNDVLRGLVLPLAQTVTKQDILVLIRRTNPSEMVVATDTSIGVGQLTFRFNATGRLASIVPEYDP
jgi:hypothetical protein